MKLHPERAGPYLRALSAGLHALAPHADYVPIAEAAALLEAMDPALSGALLLPAEVDIYEGMPALSWIQRTLAEQRLARSCDPPERDAAERVAASEPDLAERLRARRRLWAHLARAELLPITRVAAIPRRVGRSLAISLWQDRLAPSGWERLRLEISSPGGRAIGPLALRGERVQVGEGLRHLLARCGGLPLGALKAQLEAALGGQISRISRGRVGPFWFPGVALPPGLPEVLGRGLILHTSAEVLSADVTRSLHLDPLLPPPREPPPAGWGRYAERRFAASPGLEEALVTWAAERGVTARPIPLIPPPRASDVRG